MSHPKPPKDHLYTNYLYLTHHADNLISTLPTSTHEVCRSTRKKCDRKYQYMIPEDLIEADLYPVYSYWLELCFIYPLYTKQKYLECNLDYDLDNFCIV